MQESIHVRLLKLEGRPFERENIPLTVS